ncbi:PREDICTED: WD repeat-containing protein 88 [Haliaeetus leucocephalus]|uniref:WD repeat-containing protein 88 n=1 Tax=Haliaeetus leucocephalus TaxID=52644 RepID=UPI00053CEC56|nr:PREDICTED: WD repeat-containing protein 88 [Haliaeetus leucocephalus]
MAAGSSRGDPLALGPTPSPAEGRWEDRELRAQLPRQVELKIWFLLSYSPSWTKLSKIISRKKIPKLCSVPLQIQFKILRGHSDTVSSCHFCFEDTKILSCSYDRTVKLWDVEKGFPIQVFEEEHTAPISECNLTPDDRRGHSNAISDCCFTSDGHYLCTASWDKSLKIWDIKTEEFRCHEPVSLNEGHEGSVSSCLFSQDASLVVSGGYDNTIAIWDTDAGYKKLSLKGHLDWVTDVAISKNKKWILSASKDSTLRLWNIEKMDHIPSVIEIRKARGSKIAQCEECEKTFLCLQRSDSETISKCVFCRLSSPVRKILPLPPSVSPDV